VLKHCDENHPDYQDLVNAHEKMQEVAGTVNESMGSTAKLQSITSQIQTRSGNQRAQLHRLASPDRSFVGDFHLETDPRIGEHLSVSFPFLSFPFLSFPFLSFHFFSFLIPLKL